MRRGLNPGRWSNLRVTSGLEFLFFKLHILRAVGDFSSQSTTIIPPYWAKPRYSYMNQTLANTTRLNASPVH